jgi:FlaA1/EpsC-like NDP-sugar epimerase
MTIPEASQLILQATVMGQGGEIFVLDMGEPIKIRYLAEQLIRLSGRILGKDIEIKYTGLRPGEKLYEELFHENEALSPTKHDKILEANHRKMAWDALEGLFSHMKTACLAHVEQSLRKLLNQLVPEYQADIKDVIPA